MLSVLLSSVTNFPIGQHPHIIRLINGVFNSKPLKVKFCKNGIYHLFKNAIKCPLEPLRKTSLKNVTFKAINYDQSRKIIYVTKLTHDNN